jgi:hypothetical protein
MIGKNYFVVYEDSEGKKPLSMLTSDEIIPAGKSMTRKIFIKNISPDELQNVVLSSDDPDLTFQPSTISHMDIGFTLYEITVIWTPPKTRTEALSTAIKVEFDIIKRAK